MILSRRHDGRQLERVMVVRVRVPHEFDAPPSTSRYVLRSGSASPTATDVLDWVDVLSEIGAVLLDDNHEMHRRTARQRYILRTRIRTDESRGRRRPSERRLEDAIPTAAPQHKMAGVLQLDDLRVGTVRPIAEEEKLERFRPKDMLNAPPEEFRAILRHDTPFARELGGDYQAAVRASIAGRVRGRLGDHGHQ